MPSDTDKKEEKGARPNFALKAKYAFYSTLVFFLIANPETYKLMQRFLGGLFTVASDSGCPSTYGFFFHTLLFFFVLWGLMLFPRD
jgi:hypothetical protein